MLAQDAKCPPLSSITAAVNPPPPPPLPTQVYQQDTMAGVDEEYLPLTDPFFALEDESNINDRVLPMDPPPPSLVAQEAARPHQETDQLVCSTPHRPQHLTSMRKRRRVLLADIPPLPLQATTHHGGRADLLVCPPLPRNGVAGRELHQREMVCVTVPASPLCYEERSEVVCVGWGRMARSLPHQTSSTTEPSSGVWNNLGATGTHGHTTPTLLQLPTETTTLHTPVAYDTDTHFSCECHVDEEGGHILNSGVPMEAVGNPPPTQQLMLGVMAFQDTT